MVLGSGHGRNLEAQGSGKKVYVYYKIEVFGDGGIFILEEVAGDGAVGEGVLCWHYLLPMGGRLVGLKYFFWG